MGDESIEVELNGLSVAKERGHAARQELFANEGLIALADAVKNTLKKVPGQPARRA